MWGIKNVGKAEWGRRNGERRKNAAEIVKKKKRATLIVITLIKKPSTSTPINQQSSGHSLHSASSSMNMNVNGEKEGAEVENEERRNLPSRSRCPRGAPEAIKAEESSRLGG
jgi:hypothetical protein